MIPDRFAGFILGKNGSRIQKTASKSGCKAGTLCMASDYSTRVLLTCTIVCLPSGVDDEKKWFTGSPCNCDWELQAPSLNFTGAVSAAERLPEQMPLTRHAQTAKAVQGCSADCP